MTITIIIVIVIMSLPLLGHGYGGVLLSLGSIEKKHLCRNMTRVQRECVDASHVHRDTVCVWTNVNMLTCGCVACVCSRKKNQVSEGLYLVGKCCIPVYTNMLVWGWVV